MAVQVLETSDGEGIFSCTTTDQVFGPLVEEGADFAEAFLQWAHVDARRLHSEGRLGDKLGEFREHVRKAPGFLTYDEKIAYVRGLLSEQDIGGSIYVYTIPNGAPISVGLRQLLMFDDWEDLYAYAEAQTSMTGIPTPELALESIRNAKACRTYVLYGSDVW